MQALSRTPTPLSVAAPATEKATSRRHDLDWLRVIAILLLLFFHTGMLFVAEWDWHIKNPETSNLFLEWMYFLSRWRMALLFLISGVGTWYALGRRSGGQYALERFKRLAVPLVFGIFVVVPPQIYVERLVEGHQFASYLAFYPSVFEMRPYPQGSTSWHHLWFIAYLFIYSLAALPLFLFLRGERGRRFSAALAERLGRFGIYVFAAPLAVALAVLLVRFPGPQNVVDDWAMLTFYFLIFVFGYLFGSAAGFSKHVEANRKTSLGLGFFCMLAINYMRWNDREPAWDYGAANLLYLSLLAFNAWCWVLAILGYAKRYLTFDNRFLRYANEGIYPFYILHQTVIIVLGFYVIQVREDIVTKFVFTSILSLVLTVGLYEFLVRPFALTRFLFGMKPKPSGG